MNDAGLAYKKSSDSFSMFFERMRWLCESSSPYHYAYGAIGEWLYSYVAGIDLDPENPGYKHILLNPHPGGDLTNASAELMSLYGPVKSSWKVEEGKFTYNVTIPANTKATVTLPATEPEKISLNNTLITSDKTVVYAQDKENTVVQLGSGSYVFTYTFDVKK